MLEADRDLVLQLAKAIGADFHHLSRIMAGELSASPALAQTLARTTDTKPGPWLPGGSPKVRLVAAKLWWLKKGRLAMVDVSEAWDL